MYDMYPWNEPDSGANHDQDQNAAAPRNGAASRYGGRHANGDFTRAVQFALDRRDNGGDAVPAGPRLRPRPA